MNRKSPQIITCPSCGYTFKPDLDKKAIRCPMCGHKFRLDGQHHQKDDFDQRII